MTVQSSPQLEEKWNYGFSTSEIKGSICISSLSFHQEKEFPYLFIYYFV